ncbi:hypothetical protein NHL51_06965 [Leucobacter sp. gxy201]|uniref:hypothetical protein n=1 Tax=Leucobacter sp. gxy201 TaxID=2957200 RepID=UPI003DA020F1
MSQSPALASLGTAFSVAEARAAGLSYESLRSRRFEAPFHATRIVRPPAAAEPMHPFELQRRRTVQLIHALARRLLPGQFMSHSSAALLWGAPIPHRLGQVLHLSALSPARAPRVAGTVGHRIHPGRCEVDRIDGVPLSAPATTWAMLGGLGASVSDLVVAGDYFARRYRAGHGRREVGRPPHASLDELRAVLELGRWSGISRLARALELVREDSWSPQESLLRLNLREAGLPEPELNVDVHDDGGRFLACLDLAYRSLKVGAEYHGLMHAATYAQDVMRVEALRDDGWIIIEVTKAGGSESTHTARRIERALRSRGWAPS